MEPETYLRFLLALVFVLALIGLAAWLARRFGLAGAMPVQRGRQRRLTMVDTLAVDGKRRLVLVRRDDVEHLILLGTGPEVVVESGIAPPSDPQASAYSGAPPRAAPSFTPSRTGSGRESLS